MVLVGPLAHVPPRFAEDGGGRHDVDAIDAGQVHSRHAEQRFAHVKLRGIALLASAPPLAGLLRQIGPRAAVGPLLEVLLQALIAFGHLLLAKFVAILLLLEHKQQVFLPVPLQAAGDLFFARLDPYIAQRRQGLWVTLASQNGLDDGLSRRPAQVADHVGQLHVHLRQHFLHALDVPPRALHQVVALPPVSPQLANLLRWSERVAQQTISVQLHQPLTLLTSVFLHGRFFVSRAFTRYTSNPASSRMSYTGVQYTPVDCMATVRMPHCFSHAAISFNSTVVHPNRRTGWLSRARGTAT